MAENVLIYKTFALSNLGRKKVETLINVNIFVIIYSENIQNYIIIITIIIFKKVSNVRLRESDLQPISPKTPAPQYQPRFYKVQKNTLLRVSLFLVKRYVSELSLNSTKSAKK